MAPDFRVADEDRAKTLKAVVLEKLLDGVYEDWMETGVSRLSWTPWARGGTTPVWRSLQEVHGVLKKPSVPERWIERQLGAFSTGGVGVCRGDGLGRDDPALCRRQGVLLGGRMDALLLEMNGPANEKVKNAYGAPSRTVATRSTSSGSRCKLAGRPRARRCPYPSRV
jgi:hypothetical protein